MGKAIFEIGEKEVHVLTVGWSILTKRIFIELDDEKLVDKGHYTPTPEKFTFDVGSSEKHKVEVSVGGFSSVKVWVDGKPLEGSSI
jgi:hypothetical protein